MNDIADEVERQDREVLLEHEAKALLRANGLPVPECEFVSEAADIEAASESIGFPVVMKVVSPDIQHKSDVGGVVLGVDSPSEAADAFARLMESVSEARPDADIRGVLIEEMIDGEREVFVGVNDDRNFGLIVMAGLGGTTIELFEDVSIRLPPLDRKTCESMLESLQSYPLLTGYRETDPTDVDALVDVMTGIAGEGGLIDEIGEDIAEMDLNPIIVRESGEGCVISDALVELDRQ
jgi:acyl-CoA synthetase (NDP forming)